MLAGMAELQLQFVGCGDAFGSGGRFQACLLLSLPEGEVLIDCGASSLVAMKRQQLDPSRVGWVLLSHLHGDHFGGLPFLVLDGQFSRREQPLVIAGPAGVAARVTAAMEALFPGSSTAARRFALEFMELTPAEAVGVGPAKVTPFEVIHASGSPALCLRIEYGGKTIAYSGDTEWSDGLLHAARDADLFVCEAYFTSKRVRYHLDLETLRANVERLHCKRIVLTHMSADVLSLPEVEFERAEDGLRLVL
jgi:ribonuclease BN (tRNA processing enzyme)